MSEIRLSPAPPARRDDAVRGILLVAVGYALITCADVAVKWALPQVGIAGAMVWRGVFGALTILAVTLASGRPLAGLLPVNARLVGTRSLLHCCVSCSFYAAWLFGMPLAESYAVAAAAPLIMTVLAIPLLGEQVGWRRWTSTGVGFCGVLVMLQPGGALWRWESAALLVAVGAMALTRLWTRVLARTDRPATITFWLMVAHIPVGLALLPVFPPPVALFPAVGVILGLVAMGCGNALSHLLFSRAFGLAPVSVLAPFEYSPLIWGLVLGLLVWGEWPTSSTFTGAAIVIAAGLYNLYRERLRARALREARP